MGPCRHDRCLDSRTSATRTRLPRRRADLEVVGVRANQQKYIVGLGTPLDPGPGRWADQS